MKKLVMILLVLLSMLGVIGCGKKEETKAVPKEKEEIVYSEFKWPNSDIAKLLPVPKSNVGKVEWEASYGFVVYVAETTEEEFNEYIDACSASGFTTDYRRGDDYYFGDNVDGYSLSLHFNMNDEKDVMFVRLDEPEESEDTSTTSAASSAPGETTTSTDGVNPEYKEFLDQYEVFMNNYVEFMKKYQGSSDVTNMMSDFNTYMGQYTEMMNKLSTIDSASLTGADLIYYNEVIGRVNQKLLEIAQ